MKNTATYSKRNIAIGFGAGVYGIILLFVLISGFANATINAIDTNYGGLNYLYYFTNQSNLLCAVWMLLLCLTAFFPKLKKLYTFTRNKVVMTSLCLYITMTFIIVALWLAPIWSGKWVSDGILKGEVFFSHLLTPVVVWFLYLLVPGTGKIDWKRLFLVLVYPLIYVIVGLIVGYTGGRFPYNFIDPNFYGPHGPYIFPAVIIVLGVVFYGLTWVLYRFKKFIDTKYHGSTAP